jgi:pimeloyl-ACP methyl ester carboxylesterase
MPYTTPKASEIYYETHGDPDDRPLILIEGTGAQLLGWREAFVDLLTARGFFVVRLDNRDVGLSHLTGEPDVADGGYSLADMADDVVTVLDALDLGSAHIVGQSMGGAIAQHMAIAHPERVKSLVLFYTAPAVHREFVTDVVLAGASADGLPPPTTLEERVERLMDRARLSTAPGKAFDEVWARDLIVRSLERSSRLDGIPRQAAAMFRSGDWRERLDALVVPTAIIHGRDDGLVKIDASFELARRIANAELHLYPHMGHEIARDRWADFVTIIDATARRSTPSA